jgi:hypothetical protein
MGLARTTDLGVETDAGTVEEEPKTQGREGRTPRIQRRLGTVGASCDMEDSELGDEEDGERVRAERREQEHQGEGGSGRRW